MKNGALPARFAIAGLGIVLVFVSVILLWFIRRDLAAKRRPAISGAAVHKAALFDTSMPLSSLTAHSVDVESAECENKKGCGSSPEASDPDEDEEREEEREREAPAVSASPISAEGAAVEQTVQGTRPRAALIDSFDGLGVGFMGPQGTAAGRNPSDNSLAVGPNHIVQIVNSRMAVYTKKGAQFDTTGKVLYGPVVTNAMFAGFGGQCEHRVSGDAVVRYDQLADRWLYVLPIFRRPPDDPKGPYSMCYAVSVGADPLGPYHRYEFKRPLFPDYPRPAIWPDGYYIPTSTGDTVIQKHACVADRSKMLQGLQATEQCVIIDGVNFLNNADIDGQELPPAGAPNIMMAAGGSQLLKNFEDDGIYTYNFHVDWATPAKTTVSPATKIKVAPYHYLCDGQLTNCVSQPGTDRRLDAQGDKLMQRLVYRNLGGHESIAALHSINTSAQSGGVRWYEFRLDEHRNPYLYQQGTYAPDRLYRWIGSIGIDRQGSIGIGYSFGGAPNFAGQRFAGRLEGDPLGQLTFHETVLAEGAAPQTNTLRWEDYTTTAMDPSDNCTFWYVGDYLKKDAVNYSSRIGSFRLPGCLRGKVSGTLYFDINHDGKRTPGEPGLPGQKITVAGSEPAELTTDASGNFFASLNADPAYANTNYTLTQRLAPQTRHPVQLKDGDNLSELDFASVCVVPNQGGKNPRFWSDAKTVLASHRTEWPGLLSSKLFLVNADGTRFQLSGDDEAAYQKLRAWLRSGSSVDISHALSQQLAATALNVAFGAQDGKAAVLDPVKGNWPVVNELVERASAFISAHPNESSSSAFYDDGTKYKNLLESINRDTAKVTPSDPGRCASQSKK